MQCPQCGSERLYRDGLRYLNSGETVQRWLCRNCGFRFSDSNHRKQFYNESSEKVKRLACDIENDAQQHQKSVLLEAEKTISEKREAGATQTAQQDVKGVILEFLWHLKKKGKAEATIKTYSKELRYIAEQNVTILSPEEVEEYLAKAKFSRTMKSNLTYLFKSFYKFLKIQWEAPSYKPENKIPFIPTEQELDTLISNASKNVSAFLSLLKDTGMRFGEALKLEWQDIDFERKVVRISAEKSSNPRVLPLTENTLTFLQRLQKKRNRIFIKTSITTTFYKLRKRLAYKLNNPRLLQIGFHTFRHWKGTMEYHKTKDILHVKEVLGHKSIQNTLIYVHMEKALFQNVSDEFTVKTAKTLEEAVKLAEVGFEYWDTIDGIHVYRKRK